MEISRVDRKKMVKMDIVVVVSILDSIYHAYYVKKCVLKKRVSFVMRWSDNTCYQHNAYHDLLELVLEIVHPL